MLKLCFFAPRQYIFGIRKQLLEDQEDKKVKLRRTIEFSIEPQRDTVFFGIDARYTTKGIQDIKDFLSLLDSED